MTPGPRPPEQSGELSRIGWTGDFYTASDVHPLLAQCLAKQIQEIDDLLGCPSQLTVVEMGPGKGLLAREILRALEKNTSTLASRLTYQLIERSPVMKCIQERNLNEFTENGWSIEWASSLTEFDAQTVTGVIFSNEFVDALPVHRVKMTGSVLKEVFVDYQDGEFCERLDDFSVSEIGDYFAGIERKWSEGYCTEVHVESVRWMKDVAHVLQRGVVLTIDYGHTEQDYYESSRNGGTLLCYHRHSASTNPYVRVGEQDITAHVNFTALAKSGSRSGLSVTGFTNLINFLLGLGADQMLAELDPESKEMQSAIQFLRPQSMGQTFKVLVQHKEVESPTLQGLRFRPFFREALLGASEEIH